MRNGVRQFLILVAMLYVNTVFAQMDSASFDYSEKELYEFMSMVIKDQNLNKTYGLACKVDQNKYDLSFLMKYAIDSALVRDALAYDSVQRQLGKISFKTYLYEDKLTPKDIASFLQNSKNVNTTYRWKNGSFGFDPENKNEWYVFTLPVFNADKTEALVTIRYSCTQFLCGNESHLLYKKINGEWTCQTLSQWFN